MTQNENKKDPNDSGFKNEDGISEEVRQSENYLSAEVIINGESQELAFFALSQSSFEVIKQHVSSIESGL